MQPRERGERGERALSEKVFPEVAKYLAPVGNAWMDLGGVRWGGQWACDPNWPPACFSCNNSVLKSVKFTNSISCSDSDCFGLTANLCQPKKFRGFYSGRSDNNLLFRTIYIFYISIKYFLNYNEFLHCKSSDALWEFTLPPVWFCLNSLTLTTEKLYRGGLSSALYFKSNSNTMFTTFLFSNGKYHVPNFSKSKIY